MIQRVQTLYLGIVVILLSIITFGMEIVSFVGESTRYTFSSYGILEYSKSSNELIGTQNYPFYIATIALILLSLATIFSYKNINRQFKLGRTVLGLYFVSVLVVIAMTIFGGSLINDTIEAREMGIGYIVFVAGLPFSFLANVGIKRDKNLLNSLDRLR